MGVDRTGMGQGRLQEGQKGQTGPEWVRGDPKGDHNGGGQDWNKYPGDPRKVTEG